MTGLVQGAAWAQAPWFPLGPYGGDARSLVADPLDAKHLFLGTETGWLYDSHDGGSTWSRVAQVAHRNDLVLDNILVDRTNPKRLIVGAFSVGHVGGGLYVSEDFGKNWYAQAELRGQSVRALARSDSDPNLLVAGTLKGVFRSTDNGKHWQQISPVDSKEIHEIESIAIDPTDPNTIYAGTWHLPWKTSDGGATWHNIKAGIIDDSDVFSIIVDPKEPNVVYASACSGIYKSSDGGDLFHKVQGIPSAARRTRKLAQDVEHLDVVFAGTTEGLYRSTDAGTQWERLTPADVIVNDVYIDPTNANHVLIATDRGGIYRSEDGGTSFEPSNAGFSTRQVTAYAADAQRPDTVYVGVVNDKATGGVFQSNDGGVKWEQTSEGLGGRDVFSLVSMEDGSVLAGTGHGIFRLDSGTWKDSGALEGKAAREKAAVAAAKPATSAPAHLVVETVHGAPTLKVTRSAELPPRPGAVKTPKRGASRKTATRNFTVPVHAKSRKGAVPRQVSGTAKMGRVAQGTKPKLIKTRTANTAGLHVAPTSQPAVAQHVLPHTTKPSPEAAGTAPNRTDAAIFAMARTHDTVFAGGSNGLLRSNDGGQHWAEVRSLAMPEVHYVAMLAPAADGAQMVLAGGLERLALSPDGGATWDAVPLPADLTQIGAVTVDGDKNLWVGGREGVWFSTDYGANWKSLRNLFVTEVDSLYYDAGAHRVLVTSSTSPVAFSVEGAEHKVTYWDTGWKLRFVRPVGDHLIGATLFDGVVVQPKMVETPQAPANASLK